MLDLRCQGHSVAEGFRCVADGVLLPLVRGWHTPFAFDVALTIGCRQRHRRSRHRCNRGCFPPAEETPGPDEIALARGCLLADERSEFPSHGQCEHGIWHCSSSRPGRPAKARERRFGCSLRPHTLHPYFCFLSFWQPPPLPRWITRSQTSAYNARATAKTLEHTMPGAQSLKFMGLVIND